MFFGILLHSLYVSENDFLILLWLVVWGRERFGRGGEREQGTFRMQEIERSFSVW